MNPQKTVEPPQRRRGASPAGPALRPSPSEALAAFRRIRDFSRVICSFLEPEDCVVQSMPDASPIRWHLAHTTWFFETFVLRSLRPEYQSPSSHFQHLFNSYYHTVGEPFPRHQRGLLSRPTVEEVWNYRRHVDEAIEDLLGGELPDAGWERTSPVFQIGLQHEQQHQELMLTDIKHAFSCNPLYPAFDPQSAARSASCGGSQPVGGRDEWLPDDGGIVEIGHAGEGFAYDNESPRHRVLLQPFAIARTPVSNGQFAEFIEDGGYQTASLWLDAGWKTVQQQGSSAPLYWIRRDDQWWEFTLGGLRLLRLDEPVCHVSFFEADAFARWRGCRLPTEAEWEHVATRCVGQEASYGTFAEDAVWHPRPCGRDATETPGNGKPSGSRHAAGSAETRNRGVTSRPGYPRQMFGDVWEWTASPYLGYPGYRPPEGAIGEYNGKFMCNQFVLRGGSAATSRDHVRPTYRNFFAPDARWQFSGIRLAQ